MVPLSALPGLPLVSFSLRFLFLDFLELHFWISFPVPGLLRFSLGNYFGLICAWVHYLSCDPVKLWHIY